MLESSGEAPCAEPRGGRAPNRAHRPRRTSPSLQRRGAGAAAPQKPGRGRQRRLCPSRPHGKPVLGVFGYLPKPSRPLCPAERRGEDTRYAVTSPEQRGAPSTPRRALTPRPPRCKPAQHQFSVATTRWRKTHRGKQPWLPKLPRREKAQYLAVIISASPSICAERSCSITERPGTGKRRRREPWRHSAPSSAPEAAAGVRVPPGRTQNGETGSWQEASVGPEPKSRLQEYSEAKWCPRFPRVPPLAPPTPGLPASSERRLTRTLLPRQKQRRERSGAYLCRRRNFFLKKKPKTED